MRNYKPTVKFVTLLQNTFAVSGVSRGQYVPGKKCEPTHDAIECTLQELLDLIDWFNASPRDRITLGLPEPRVYAQLKAVGSMREDSSMVENYLNAMIKAQNRRT